LSPPSFFYYIDNLDIPTVQVRAYQDYRRLNY
jgi:hypothetical protein